MKGIEGRRRWWSVLGGEAYSELFGTLKSYRQNQRDMQSGGCKRSGLRRGGSGKSRGDFCLVTLTALCRGLAGHGMLAMSLAAVLCHFDIASSLLEAGKAGPH